MISADLDVVDRDELEPAHAVSMASVLNMLAAEYDVLRDLIAEQGLDELYKQVKKNASERRAEVTERANEAHRRHQLRPSNQN
jgi:ketol-acid reductoisomerase